MLTNLTSVKLYLGITNTDSDTLLTALISEADKMIKNYCRKQLESNIYTEFYSGDGTNALRLRQGPVTHIQNIWTDPGGFFGQGTNSPFSSTTLLTAGADYALNIDQWDGVTSVSRIVFRLVDVWQPAWVFVRGRLYAARRQAVGNIKVQYTAGYPVYLLSAVTIAGGGTGYVQGDTITIGTTTTGIDAAVLSVQQVDGSGTIQSVAISNPGNYPTSPSTSLTQASTSGVGTGATFTGTFATGIPADLQGAANLLVARLKNRLPLGWIPSSESYEDRSITLAVPQSGDLLRTPDLTNVLSNYRAVT